MMKSVYKTDLPDVKLLHAGKVREIYEIEDKLLIISSDRISAFDVIMNETVSGKGKILNQITTYWLKETKDIIENHFYSDDLNEYPEILKKYNEQLSGRSMLVKRTKPLPVECVVRGYIAGSGWREYQENGKICGVNLPESLKKYEKLSEPIFTPATKAESGHDENITFEQFKYILGEKKAEYLKEISLKLYNFGAKQLESKGIIVADTKFEFGELPDGTIILIDEALTPDSSRFWPKEKYSVGKEQESYDKQILRDYLESLNWDKNPPPPQIPDEIIDKLLKKYKEIYLKITGNNFNG